MCQNHKIVSIHQMHSSPKAWCAYSLFNILCSHFPTLYHQSQKIESLEFIPYMKLTINPFNNFKFGRHINVHKKRRCKNTNIKIGMKTWITCKRSYKKWYINKNLTTRNNNKCTWKSIGKKIKVFQMQINVRVGKMPRKITNYFKNKTIKWRGGLLVSWWNWMESTLSLLI
jgi:hypothetical protein